MAEYCFLVFQVGKQNGNVFWSFSSSLLGILVDLVTLGKASLCHEIKQSRLVFAFPLDIAMSVPLKHWEVLKCSSFI